MFKVLIIMSINQIAGGSGRGLPLSEWGPAGIGPAGLLFDDGAGVESNLT